MNLIDIAISGVFSLPLGHAPTIGQADLARPGPAEKGYACPVFLDHI